MVEKKAPRRLVIALSLALLLALLGGCSTTREAAQIPEPRSFSEALIIAQGEIKALREATATVAMVRGEDCIANPYTDLCSAARKIGQFTREARGKIDLIHDAYHAASEMMFDCRIEYNGAVLACEDEYDSIMFGIIQLRTLLPAGSK